MVSNLNHYTVYGLRIQSEVPLPELNTIDPNSGPSDVLIRSGDTDQLLASSDSETDTTSKEIGSLGVFVMIGGKEIVFDLHSLELSRTKYFRRVITNQMLGRLLLQRGLLVLHASSVVVDGRAVVFIGPRTAGKSTTAAAFHTHGYPVLADDIVGIRHDEDPPMVVPGVPELRLSQEAATALNLESAVSPDHDRGKRKWHQQVDGASEPHPLACCYALEEGDSIAVEPLSGSEQFFRLTRHAYHHGFLSETAMTPTGFRQCSTVVERVPVRRLRRPKRYDLISSLVDTVVQDIIEKD